MARRSPQTLSSGLAAFALTLALARAAHAWGAGPFDVADNVVAEAGVDVTADTVTVRALGPHGVELSRSTTVENRGPECATVELRLASGVPRFESVHVLSVDDQPSLFPAWLPEETLTAAPCGTVGRVHRGSPAREKRLFLRLPAGSRATLTRRTSHPDAGERGTVWPRYDTRHAVLRRAVLPMVSEAYPAGFTVALPVGPARPSGAPMVVVVDDRLVGPGRSVVVAARDRRGKWHPVPPDAADGAYRPFATQDALRATLEPEDGVGPTGGPVVEVALPAARPDQLAGRVGWEWALGAAGALALATEHRVDGRHGAALELLFIGRHSPSGFLDLTPRIVTVGAGVVGAYLPAPDGGLRLRLGVGGGGFELGARADLLSTRAELSPYVLLGL